MSQISPKILNVCPSWVEVQPHNEYNDIQRAIDAIPAYGQYIIRLHDNFMDVPELRLTNDRIQVKIDGQTEYGIYFRAGDPICTLSGRKTLKFSDITYIRGDAVIIRDDSYLHFYDCQSVMTRVDIVDGKYAHVYVFGTKLYGTDNNPAISLFNPDSKLTISESYVKGGRRCPALYFNTSSDKKVKMKNSVILHYEGTDHCPITRNSGTLVGLYAYNCVGDSMLCDNNIANYLGTHNDNCFDPVLDF